MDLNDTFVMRDPNVKAFHMTYRRSRNTKDWPGWLLALTGIKRKARLFLVDGEWMFGEEDGNFTRMIGLWVVTDVLGSVFLMTDPQFTKRYMRSLRA